MKRVSFPEFIQRCSTLKIAVSITRTASYEHFRTLGNKLSFDRVNTKKSWQIDLHQLYDAYQQLDIITPTILKRVMSGRIYSPAWAVLVDAGFYNRYGHKI